MWDELKAEMEAQGWAGLDKIEEQWAQNLRTKRIVSQFMKDVDLGDKRLMSMPDRVTNTIHANGGDVCRPSVINGYSGKDMGDVESWWPKWRSFFFHQQIRMPSRTGGGPEAVLPCNLLQPIKRAKYPAVTA